MKWQNIEDIYNEPDFKYKKGSIVLLQVDLEGDFNLFESNIMGIKLLLSNWSYSNNSREIFPYQLMEYSKSDVSFTTMIRIMKKSKKTDELYLLCQDILDVLNYENIIITKWKVQSITTI